MDLFIIQFGQFPPINYNVFWLNNDQYRLKQEFSVCKMLSDTSDQNGFMGKLKNHDGDPIYR